MSNFPKGGNNLRCGVNCQIYCEDEFRPLGEIYMNGMAARPLQVGNFISSEIVAHTGDGAVFYLEDGGYIEFFAHDKPQEYYKSEACIVRNTTLPALYAIRVPANTPASEIGRYAMMFVNRSTIEARAADYDANSPYPYEREIGINCGLRFDGNTSDSAPSSYSIQDQPRAPIFFTCKHPEDAIANNAAYRAPIANTYAVYPKLINRVQSYLDTTVPEDKPFLVSSDDCGAKSSTTDSSKCPVSANELLAQRHNHTYQNIDVEFGFNQKEKRTKKNYVSRDLGWSDHDSYNSRGVDLRANSGGYGRMYQSHTSTGHPGRYVHDPMLVMRQMQSREMQGSFIPVIPVRSGNDPNNPLPPRHLNKKTNALYKTEMCRNWNEIGECRYGRSCQFAHGKKELRTVARHGQWKTKTCMAWLHGGCTYGSRCCYAHEIMGDGATQPQSPASTEPSSSTNLVDVGESRFSNFFASRCWS